MLSQWLEDTERSISWIEEIGTDDKELMNEKRGGRIFGYTDHAPSRRPSKRDHSLEATGKCQPSYS